MAEEQKKNNSLKDQATFGTGIAGGILVLFIFFFILNYFNILSLSALYPRMFGLLPHQPFNNVQKTELKADLLTDNPKFKNYTKLDNQVTDAQMSNYFALINSKEIPLDDAKYPDEIYGIFSGFDNNYIQIVTYNGIKNLAYTKDLTIQKYQQEEKSATQSAVIVGTTQIDKSSFFNQSMFGKILHLSITLTSPKTIQQIYLNE